MAREWRASTWGDEISLEYGRGLRGYETGQGRYRVFGSNGPIGWSNEKLAEGPGVILGRKGAYRGVEFSREPFFVIDTAYYVVPKSKLDMRWLYYAVKHYKLGEIDDGSPIPSTTRAAVYMRELNVPPLDEQREIARILGTLDDKIELNRRMSETLEAIAHALFKSWFVDFDPVRAKLEGSDPGLAKSVADLFPARFVDADVGPIPAGWDVVPLSALIEINPSRRLRSGEIAPYLDMANMPTGGHSPSGLTDRPFGSGARFVNGDTLVARITPCLENGKTAYVDFLREGQVGWGSTEYIVLRPRPPIPNEFAYYLARSNGFREYAIQSMTGSSGRQRVPSDSLSRYRLVCPSPQVADEFGRLVRPLIARAAATTHESHTLTTLRDALLPKLMSSELSASHAERIADVAA